MAETQTISKDAVLKEIKDFLGESLLNSAEPYGMLTIEISPDKILDLTNFLYDHETLKFQFLTDLCGIHYPDNEGKELGVIYHFHSLENNIRLRVKAFISEKEPKISSLCSVYASADWMERETYDFFGIIFEEHPDLRRILNVDEMEVFPMRKEYPLEDPNRNDKQDLYFGR